jgi:hypothetical protein
MKKLLSAVAAFLFATALASAWQYPGGPGGAPSSNPTWGLGGGPSIPKREKPPEFRNLTGVVLDKADSPLKDAVVYLKNRKTKALTTYIAGADGAFHFPNLSRTVDYEVYAELKGGKSPVKTLSSFDTRVNVKFNLYVEPAQEKAGEKDAKKEEKKTEQVAAKEEKKAEATEEKKDQPKSPAGKR